MVCGVLAGITSTVAGLASVVSYPTLLWFGLPAVQANVTNTVSLVFVAVGAAIGSRSELAGQYWRLMRMGPVSLAGGVTGALLLLASPAGAFEAVVPWLVAGAGVLVLCRHRLMSSVGGGGLLDERGPPLAVALFVSTVYTGYFGAGGGIILFAVLGAAIPEPLPRVNAMKNVLLGMPNGVAAAAFTGFGPVYWPAVPPLACGLLIGGALGPAIVRRLRVGALRLLIGVAAIGFAVKFAVDAYL
ncbi:sulfite exporter TauE/SafE family protein [Protofrankia coriariae]|uniref:sulfite exporter TauE/SafE family protein n=1 Tax=Protofrankia coriariae TaxID=1562887 RepID=UPI000A31F96C|nr:sulfite exporter TauE/SafE family protein [Protofrankia coriariae]